MATNPNKRRGTKLPTFVLLNPPEKAALKKLALETERSVGYYIRQAVVKFLTDAGLLEKPKTGKVLGAARVVLALLALSLTSSLYAQTTARKSPAKISDAFATAGIRALRAIQSAAPTSDEKMDEADSQAASKAEQSLMSAIRLLYFKKIDETLKREGDAPSKLTTCMNDMVATLRARSSAIPKSCPQYSDELTPPSGLK